MGNEIQKSEGREIASAATPTGSSLLALVVEAARDPEIDASKMKTLADLAIQMEDREAEKRYRAAKAAAMAELPSIGKRGEILNKQGRVQSRFSHFETLHSVVVPILERHHLSMDFQIGEAIGDKGSFVIPVECVLTYADGELTFTAGGGALPFPIDNMGGKSPVQGVASSLSMGKRHTMKAFLNIREHDENAGEGGGSGDQDHTDAEKVLIEEARAAASEGRAGYKAFWEKCNAQERAFLVSRGDQNGAYHEQNKQLVKALERQD